MLTEIEWWGGVLFIVGAVVYRMAIGALDKDAGFDANRLLSHVFFLAPAVVLAGYFYPLERPGLRYAYLGVLAVALAGCSSVMMRRAMKGSIGAPPRSMLRSDGLPLASNAFSSRFTNSCA